MVGNRRLQVAVQSFLKPVGWADPNQKYRVPPRCSFKYRRIAYRQLGYSTLPDCLFARLLQSVFLLRCIYEYQSRQDKATASWRYLLRRTLLLLSLPLPPPARRAGHMKHNSTIVSLAVC